MAGSDIFGGVGGIFGAVGSVLGGISESNAFYGAANLEQQNAKYRTLSGAVQEMQLHRAAFKAIGGERADVASSGLAQTGSAKDIIADSTRQAGMSFALSGLQTQIDVNSYKAQQQLFNSQGQASFWGGIGGAIGDLTKAATSFFPGGI